MAIAVPAQSPEGNNKTYIHRGEILQKTVVTPAKRSFGRKGGI
jgi:hypothetical protein